MRYRFRPCFQRMPKWILKMAFAACMVPCSLWDFGFFLRYHLLDACSDWLDDARRRATALRFKLFYDEIPEPARPSLAEELAQARREETEPDPSIPGWGKVIKPEEKQ